RLHTAHGVADAVVRLPRQLARTGRGLPGPRDARGRVTIGATGSARARRRGAEAPATPGSPLIRRTRAPGSARAPPPSAGARGGAARGAPRAPRPSRARARA